MTSSSGFQNTRFALTFGPNYHPTFQLRLPTDTEEVTVTVRDRTDADVWKRIVDVSGKVFIYLQHHKTAEQKRAAADH